MSEHTNNLDAIIGQRGAVATMRRALRLRALADTAPKAPLAFVFAGPEGCGKGFAAEQLAKADGLNRPVLRIPMGTFQNDNEAAGLIGLRPIYSSARPGQLTAFVRENPEALIVFEEIDRAHPNVQDVLAPMLTKGQLVDQCGFYEGDPKKGVPIAPPEVDFSRTMLVFTTNLGHRVYNDESWLSQLESKPGLLNSTLIQAVSSETSGHFREGMSAIGRSLMTELANAEWVLFKRLDLPALLEITKHQFALLDVMARRAGFMGMQLADGSESAANELLTAIVLAHGPVPRPALLEAGDLARLYLAPVLEQGGAGIVTVHLSETAKTNLHRVLTTLGSEPLRNLFRKNWMLQCSVSTRQMPTGAQVLIDGCDAIRVPSRQDFGKAGLAVDLPEQQFSSIAGHQGAKARLGEVIRLLRQPETLSRWQVAAPRGMLLWGPPGTGKTMLARAFACEADLPFIATTGTEMLDPNWIARVFDLARKYAPAAIFIDEIDALGRRDQGGTGHAINQLLAELDGFDGHRDPLFIIAATNLPERIDPAILRSGRLDLTVEIPALDAAARTFFINRLRPMARLTKAQWQDIVEQSVGMTGADLEKLRRELAYDLLRCGRKKASHDEILEHINIIKYGVRDTRERTREEMEHVAYHEAGHLLLSQLLNPEVKIQKVSLTPRGNTNGFVEFDMETLMNRRMTKKEVKEMLIILMGGRAAQMLKFGEDGIDAGAADDLRKARALAKQAIEEWGMGDPSAEATQLELSHWVDQAIRDATTLLRDNTALLDSTVQQIQNHREKRERK